MRITSKAIGLAIVILLAAMLVSSLRPESPPGPPPTFSVVDVPKMVYRGQIDGERIRVVLRFPLRFSADRLAGCYSPSVEGDAAKTVLFHFRSPCLADPKIVTGAVSEFRFDRFERMNRLPGYAVLFDCEPD